MKLGSYEPGGAATFHWRTISECAPDKNADDAVVLTLDIDWACDDVLSDTIDLVERAGAPATWFITHDTPLLARLRANEGFELGVHPNFNPLLDGSAGNAEQVLDSILEIVPEAVSVRSHSMVQSSRLLELFSSRGLMFDCNHFIPAQSEITLKPWELWNGMVKVPHFWEDDVAFIVGEDFDCSVLLNQEGLKVFDFHPIHIFLNTEDPARYESTRDLHSDAGRLLLERFPGVGTRSHFLEVLRAYQSE